MATQTLVYDSAFAAVPFAANCLRVFLVLTNQNYNCISLVIRVTAVLSAWVAVSAAGASAQVVEAVGSRALGMGGAFVAVASDSSATWWNPSGLGAGPFFDMALARASTEAAESLPSWRQRIGSFTVGTPPVGFSYYRLRIIDIQDIDPTGGTSAGREDKRAGVPVRSLSASQMGLTLVQTLLPWIHAGTTLKYLRGSLRDGREDPLVGNSNLLDRGDAFEGGDTESRFDLDVGILALVGPLRLGGVVRNVREPEFGGAGTGSSLRMPRQVRVGAAVDSEPSTGVPFTVALDADLRGYATTSGKRRVVALGAEWWLFAKRFGIRGGGRINTVGARERSAAAGVSVAVWSGLFVDAHVVGGGAADEQGWGLAARVSF